MKCGRINQIGIVFIFYSRRDHHYFVVASVYIGKTLIPGRRHFEGRRQIY